jgi:hypothetical protein
MALDLKATTLNANSPTLNAQIAAFLAASPARTHILETAEYVRNSGDRFLVVIASSAVYKASGAGAASVALGSNVLSAEQEIGENAGGLAALITALNASTASPAFLQHFTLVQREANVYAAAIVSA